MPNRQTIAKRHATTRRSNTADVWTQASPLIKYQSFGKSGEGRDLPLLIASEDDAFSPEAAHTARKPVILIQACIHAGEPDGKDAGLALLRDIAITKTRAGLLKNRGCAFHPDLQHRRSRALKSIQSHQSKRTGRDGMAHDEPLTKTSTATT